MDARSLAILVTLVVYQLVLLGIGLFARARTRDTDDYFLAGRRMGPLVAAISASASSSSVWTLLGVSGYAYAKGLVALWLFPACVGGFALNWFLIAPRLRRHSAAHGALTLTEVLAGSGGRSGRAAIRALASLLIVCAFTVYIAAQLQGAGATFESNLDLDATSSVLIGSAIIVLYTMLGGFWAVSLTDTLQGLLMALTALILPVLALVAVGGPAALREGLESVAAQESSGPAGAIGLGLVLGLLGIGLGYPGQPHVVNRFMALRGERAVRTARRYAMLWAVLVYAGMLGVGLCARVLLRAEPEKPEQAMLVLIGRLCPPVLAGVMLASVLSAVMSTADSQLLVASSSVTHDLGWHGASEGTALWRARGIVLVVCAAAVLLALGTEQGIFARVLSAWDVLGAAFGPLLVVILLRGPVRPAAALASMATGAGLSITASALDWQGVMQRVLPYLGALAVLGVVQRLSRSRRID